MHLEIRFSHGKLMRFSLNGDFYVLERFAELLKNIRSGCINKVDYVSNFLWTKDSFPFIEKVHDINRSVRYFNDNNGYGETLAFVEEASRGELNALHLAFEKAANRYLPSQLLSSDHNQEIDKLPPRCDDIDALAFHLNNVNSVIHSLESALSLSDNYVNAYLSVYLRDLTKETSSVPFVERDSELFTLGAKFGEILLGYGTTGKNLFHIYQDDDIDFLKSGNQPSPQTAITSNVLAWFSEDKIHDEELDRFHSWCEATDVAQFGLDPYGKLNSLGYIKLGDYIVPPQLVGASRKEIIAHYAGLDVLDYYITP